jgi:hypothetical protein
MQKIYGPQAFQRPSGKLYLAVNQLNLVHNVPTKVLLDTIAANYADGIESTVNHRITPGVAGYYSICGQVAFWLISPSKAYVVYIYRSGFNVCTFYANGSVLDIVSGSCCLPNCYLTATDFVELYAESLSGDNNVDIILGEVHTFLAVQRVR